MGTKYTAWVRNQAEMHHNELMRMYGILIEESNSPEDLDAHYLQIKETRDMAIDKLDATWNKLSKLCEQQNGS